MSKKYHLTVYLLRGQPVHNAHVQTIRNALEISNRVVVIVCSANQPRTIKNPFTTEERSSMIRAAFPIHSEMSVGSRVIIECAEDQPYNNTLWASNINQIVENNRYSTDKFVGIIGHSKDESSFYLKSFPQWTHIEQELIEPLNATDIRDMYFGLACNLNYFKGVLPETTINFLKEFNNTLAWDNLHAEKSFIDGYKQQYSTYPYPPIFVTTDAVCIQSGHVLMIQRRSAPGKGLWAMPGGFLNANTDKSIEDCMIRELYEETNIDVPEKVVRGSIKATRVFDAIDRSSRGRTITHVSLILFNDGEWKLPKTRAADDAIDCKWKPISELKRDQVFEDHFSIIHTMIGMISK